MIMLHTSTRMHADRQHVCIALCASADLHPASTHPLSCTKDRDDSCPDMSLNSLLLCYLTFKPQKLEAKDAGTSELFDAGASLRLSTLSVEVSLSGRSNAAARSVLAGLSCWLRASRARLLN